MMTTQKKNRKLRWKSLQGYIAILTIIAIATSLIFQYAIPNLYFYYLYPLYMILTIGGGFLVFDLICKVINFDFGSDLLAGISIVTSIILGEYLAGSFVVLMLSGGETLENFAVRKASKVLEALAKRAPLIAHCKKNGMVEDISIGKIVVGDTVLIFPHEICPVDGEVLLGNSVMDESYLTGEPFLISKVPGSKVVSGAINGEGSLTIRASRVAEDSQYAKIMQVMRESEQKRPFIRRLADQLGAWYTPLAVIIAIFAWIWSGQAIRFLSVLVIATPCPLLIAIPVAIIGSISLSTQQGILIKNPIVLEQISLCQTMIFDKTGTLTYGIPILTEQMIYNQMDSKNILKIVASIERYSKHPLASAILKKAKQENIELIDAIYVSEPKGEGLKAIVNGHDVIITNRKKLEEVGLKAQAHHLPQGAGLECMIVIDGELAAHYRFRDVPRVESQSFIQHLQHKHNIKKVLIVSGDREEEVKYLANSIGVSEIFAGKTPQEKVDIVLEETKKAKTVYLGDGINDAPALVVATVGVAFGQNSDVTAEAAGAVILESSLGKVDELLHISQRMRTIALQSAIGGISLSMIGMIIAVFGYLPPVVGAISQEVIDIIVILNALRTIWKPVQLTDMPMNILQIA